MMTHYLPAAFLALLATFFVHAVHAAEPAAAVKMGAYYGSKATEYPAWFKTSFLDLREDVDEARKTANAPS